MSKIYFFRHAQASFGADNYDVLSTKGEEQSAILGQYLAKKAFRFDTIYVGPLQRQQHTYEIVKAAFKQHGLSIPDPIQLDGLKEHNATKAMKSMMPKLMESDPIVQKIWVEAGDDPSKKRSATMRCFQYFLDEWVEGNFIVEGVLPWKDFRRDVKQGLDTILHNTKAGETVAVFTSGGTISAITAESLQITNQKRVAALNYAIRNTSFTSFLYSKGMFNMLAFNELPHLPKEMVTFV